MDTKVTIEKLNNKNYFNWKFKMELMLIKEKIWFTTSQNAPSPITDAWTNADATARALIGLNIDDSQLQYVRNTTNAKEAWKALKDVHEKSTLTNKVTVMRQMYDQKMQEGQDMEQHLGKMSSYFQQLADLGEKVEEINKVALILSSLPPSWHTLITALEVRDEKELSLNLVESFFTTKN